MAEKIVHLNALDLDVFVPEEISFHDDGFVDDLGAHEYFINWRYRGNFPPIESFSTSENNKGHILYSAHFKCFHIAYLNSSSHPLHTRVHEETHFLHAVKRLPILSQRIMQRQGVEIDFDKIKGEIEDPEERRETFAEIGGVFAQYQRIGWQGVCDFYASRLPRSEFFDDAFKIYSRAIEESLKKSKDSTKSRGLVSKLASLFKN